MPSVLRHAHAKHFLGSMRRLICSKHAVDTKPARTTWSPPFVASQDKGTDRPVKSICVMKGLRDPLGGDRSARSVLMGKHGGGFCSADSNAAESQNHHNTTHKQACLSLMHVN